MTISTKRASVQVADCATSSKVQKLANDSVTKPLLMVSWNVNGIRACAKKPDGFVKFVKTYKPDILCLQEVRCKEAKNPQPLTLLNYRPYWYEAQVRGGGYSGVAIYTKANLKPKSVKRGIGLIDDEGRVMTMEFDQFYLVNSYTPNSGGSKLDRLDFRTKEWDTAFQRHIDELEAKKPVIVTGDLNVCRREIDIHAPDRYRNKQAGFCDGEREGIESLLKQGQRIDVWSHLYPNDQTNHFTFFSNLNKLARQENKGWRLDYFIVSQSLIKQVKEITVLKNQPGSDHVPVLMKLELNSEKKDCEESSN